VISDFDLNLLRIAVAIYDEHSITLAAKKLRMCQPAVSSALNKLRAAFNDPLFVKTSRGMEPTARAVTLNTAAREVLSRVEREVFSNVEFNPATSRQPFTFALAEATELILFPKLAECLRHHAPYAPARSVFPAPAETSQQLESGEIDLAIGRFSGYQKANYFQQSLYEDEFVCLIRADHPVQGERLSLEQYRALPQVEIARPYLSRPFLDHVAGRRIERKIALRTSHFLSLPAIIQRTDLIATILKGLASYLCLTNNNLRMIRPPNIFPRPVLYQFWHRKFHRDPRIKWLRGLVSSLCPAHLDWEEWYQPGSIKPNGVAYNFQDLVRQQVHPDPVSTEGKIQSTGSRTTAH
jgi:DNA-binding transcriptional LysR family regulator